MRINLVDDTTYNHAETAEEAVELITKADRVYVDGPIYTTVKICDYDRANFLRTIVRHDGYDLTVEQHEMKGSNLAVYSARLGKEEHICWIRSGLNVLSYGSIWGGE